MLGYLLGTLEMMYSRLLILMSFNEFDSTIKSCLEVNERLEKSEFLKQKSVL